MANSATRMLLPRNGNSFPLHLLRAAPMAADALSSVSYLKPNPETRQPSFLAHLLVNDGLFCRNDSPTGALLDWRRAEAAAPAKKKEEVKEEIDGKRTNDLDDVHVFSDDDSDCEDEFDEVEDDEVVDDDDDEDEDSE